MFVLYCALISIGIYVARCIRERIDDHNARQNAIKRGERYYYDWRTDYMIDVNDGHMFKIKNINGDVCEVGPYGHILRNESAEQRVIDQKIGIENAKQEGCPYYLYDREERPTHYADGYGGRHYKRFDNNEMYVKRKAYGYLLYINVNTHMIEEYVPNEDYANRYSDRIKRHVEEYNEDIRQKKGEYVFLRQTKR